MAFRGRLLIYMIITEIFILISILIIFNFIIYIGLKSKKQLLEKQDNEIFISIVVAAKNEKENIISLIHSIKETDFPQTQYEVIIVDDNSNDNTFEAANNNTNGLSNFFIYSLKEKELPGKKGALDFGISKTKYPYILITDADCLVSKGWLKNYAIKFKEGYDFLFGIAPFIKEDNLINKISCFENLKSSILTFSAANIGFSYSAAARNFGFNKLSFYKIAGYRNTTETLSGDDDLLLREAVKNRLKIGTIGENSSFVYSFSKKTFKEYFSQRSRHTKTSFYYLPSRQIALGIWHLINLVCLFSFLLMPINVLFIIPFAIKLILDIILIIIYQSSFGYNFKLIEILFLQLNYEILLVINFFGAIFKYDKWK